MTLSVLTKSFNLISDAKHLISTATLGSLQEWFKFSRFRKTTNTKSDLMTGSITYTRQADFTVNGASERRSQTWTAQLSAHSLVNIAAVREDFALLNAFVQSSAFADYLVGKVEF
jgi:hypothetical protein